MLRGNDVLRHSCALLASILLLAVTSCSSDGDAAGDGDAVERFGQAVEMGSAEKGLLKASSQKSDGTSVVVDQVVLPDGGYVAVYADGGGAPGPQLGVSELLDPGKTSDVLVSLDQKLSADTLVHALLHTEDNKTSTFDFPQHDAPVTGDTGVIEASFEVKVE